MAPLGLSEPSSTRGVLHRYELTYEEHPVTAQSTLTQVTMCAPRCRLSLAAPVCLLRERAPSYADKELPISRLSGSAFVSGFDGFRAADVNGDGYDDVLYRKPQGWSYRLSNGATLGAEQATGIPAFPDSAELGVSLVNFDRDQTVDALVPLGGINYAVVRGSGGPFQVFPVPSTIFTPGFVASGTARSRVVGVADFNGDSLPDLAVRHACRGVTPRTVTTESGYTACRWGVALNQSTLTHSTSVRLDFANAMDFRWSPAACTEHVGPALWGTNAYDNCAEAQPGDPAFVLDVDRNGENELIVPVRRGPEGLEDDWRLLDYSMELKALGFPIGSPSALRGTGLSSRQLPRLFLDVNGDGLPDAAEVDGTKLSIAMNVGGTFDKPSDAHVSGTTAAVLSLENELRVGDFNDDGLEDIYLVSARTVLQSDGQLGFVEKTLPIHSGEDSCQTTWCPGFARRKWDQVLDFNGDGLLDILQMRNGKGYLRQRIGPAPGLLQKITGGPLRPEVRFDYKPASSPEIHTPRGCSYPQFCLRKGMWLVSEAGVKANVSALTYPAGFNRTLYSYTGGRFDVRGRGWLGFSERVAVDEQTGAKTTTTMDIGWAQGRAQNVEIYRYPGAFRPAREVTLVDDRANRTGAGRVHRRTIDYEYRDRFDGPVATSVLVQTRQTTEEAPAQGGTVGSFSPVSSRRFTFDVNRYGLVTRETSEAFEGGFTATNTVPPGAKVKRLVIQRTPSVPDELNWLVRRVDRVAVSSTEPKRDAVPASTAEPARPAVPSRTVTRVTDLRWKPETTSIEQITVEPNHAANRSLHSVTRLQYYPTGNVHAVSTTAHSGSGTTTRRIRFWWDPLDQTLMSRRENPLKHAEKFVYYAGLGELFSSEDANGLQTTIRSDRFGRPREIQPASSAGTRIRYELAPGARLLVTSTRASGEMERVYQDRWGHLVREEQSRLRGNAAIVVRTFDRRGRLRGRDASVLRRRADRGECHARVRQPRPASRDRDRAEEPGSDPGPATSGARHLARRRDLGLQRTRDRAYERPGGAIDNDLRRGRPGRQERNHRAADESRGRDATGVRAI